METTRDNWNDDIAKFDIATENELLKLKLQAEFGAECTTGVTDLPAIVVNEFLRSVYAFEKQFRSGKKQIRIFDKIGQPYFRKTDTLDERQVSIELKRLKRVMQQHNVQLVVRGKYPDRVIYDFLVEELFSVRIDDIEMPGCIHQFCYEDFHLNHELDVKQIVLEFLSRWFARKISEDHEILSETFFLPGSVRCSRAEVLERVHHVYNAYTSFRNCEYLFTSINVEWNGKDGKAVAFGKVRYDTTLETGESVHIEGPFEFYMSHPQGEWWTIFYFVFPGFEWGSYIRPCD